MIHLKEWKLSRNRDQIVNTLNGLKNGQVAEVLDSYTSLIGIAFGHPDFKDGSIVTSSTIRKIRRVSKNTFVAQTWSGSQYSLKLKNEAVFPICAKIYDWSVVVPNEDENIPYTQDSIHETLVEFIKGYAPLWRETKDLSVITPLPRPIYFIGLDSEHKSVATRKFSTIKRLTIDGKTRRYAVINGEEAVEFSLEDAQSSFVQLVKVLSEELLNPSDV